MTGMIDETACGSKIAINQMRHRDRRSGQQLIRQQRIWVIT